MNDRLCMTVLASGHLCLALLGNAASDQPGTCRRCCCRGPAALAEIRVNHQSAISPFP